MDIKIDLKLLKNQERKIDREFRNVKINKEREKFGVSRNRNIYTE